MDGKVRELVIFMEEEKEGPNYKVMEGLNYIWQHIIHNNTNLVK